MERHLAAIMAIDVVGYSRLMSLDEAGTLEALQAVRFGVFEPKVAEHHGRIFKLMGDGALVEFASPVHATECALAIQAEMKARNQGRPGSHPIEMRIGINLGDVISAGQDVYGDGVNVAARLEGIAAPGGICLSEDVARHVRGKVDARLQDLGSQRLKNIEHPVRVYRVVPGNGGEDRTDFSLHQEIRYCRSSDGTQIAYAAVGDGPPLVKAANWMTHLEYDWVSPIRRPYFSELCRTHRVIRYDQRGNGLSDWDVDNFSFERFLADLEAVAEASGIEKFALLGISQGCPVSIAYAVRHPERVTALVLYGGYACGWRARGDPEEIERNEALTNLARVGWGQSNAAFRQVFTSLFVPDGSTEQIEWFNELQHKSTSPENAARIQDAIGDIDVRDLMSKVKCPTLVLHSREEARVPFAAGQQLAKGIPGARFVPVESKNHLPLEQEPEWPRVMSEIIGFLAEHETKA